MILKKQTIWLLLIIFSFIGCATTGGVRPTSQSEKPIEFTFPPFTGDRAIPKVAVFDFNNDTPFESNVIGKGASNTLITALVKSKHFIVVERSMLAKIIEEQVLGMTGIVDSPTAAKVGKILGVDYLIMGSISEFGVKTSRTAVGYGADIDVAVGVSKGTARVVLDARVVDPTTAAIVTSISGTGSHYSSNIGLAFKEISLLSGTVGFDQTLIGKATRKAAYDIVNQLIDEQLQSSSKPPIVDNKSLMSKHFKKATQLYQQGKYEEAITEWEKVLEINPNHELSKQKIRKAKENLIE